MADLNISMILRLVDQTTAPARAAMKNVERLGGKMEQVGKDGLAWARRNEEASRARRAQLRGETMALGGMALGLYGIMRPAMAFEQQMSKVGAISRAGGADLDRMTQTARELGATTPWSARQAAEGMEYLAMAGFNVNQTIAAMPGLLELATAAGSDLGRTSDIASDMLTGFGMGADEMGRLGDVLTATFTSSNTTLEMLGETMAYTAPSARAAGVSIEQTAAMAGLLANEGIKGSRAGTALNAMLNKLASPSKEAATAMEEFGIVVKDANGDFRDVPTILAEMQKATENMGSVGRAEFLSTVFGLEAVNAASTLLEQAGAGSLQAYAESLKETGIAARVAQQMSDNASGALKRLNSATEGLLISVGDRLIPMLAKLVEELVPLVEKTMAWVDANPQLVETIAMVAAGLLAMKFAGVAVRWAIEGLFLGLIKADKALSLLVLAAGKGIKALFFLGRSAIWAGRAGFWLLAKSVTATVAAVRLLGRAFLASPIGVQIAAIAAAAFVIYDNWERIVGFVKDKIEVIRAAFDEGLLQGVFAVLTELNPFVVMIEGIKGLIGYAMELLGFPDDLVAKFRSIDLSDAGRNMIQSLWTGMLSLVDKVVQSISKKFKEMVPQSVMKLFNFVTGGGASDAQVTHTVPGKALGGPVRAGQIYRWMEEGVEFFQPSLDGNVISTRELRAMRGNSTRWNAVQIGDVHVHAAPGMSPEDVGREVLRVLRAQAEAAGAVLHDGGSYAYRCDRHDGPGHVPFRRHARDL